MSSPLPLADWYMPGIAWQQTSPFVEPVPILGPAPSDPPLICLRINQSWIPYVVGALQALNQPTTWATQDQIELQIVLENSTDLIALVGNGALCVADMLRLQNCELQISTDGGATWVTASGWDANIRGCVQGWIPPVPPPNPGGTVIQQNACNLSGYLSTAIIQISTQAVVQAANNNQSNLQMWQTLVGQIPGWGSFVSGGIAALYYLYQQIRGINLGHWQSAAVDPSLWSNVTCAIYDAIKPVGYVDATNWQTVSNNIGQIAYVHPEIPPALAQMWLLAGLPTWQQFQSAGALDVVDCTNCGGWCQYFQLRLPQNDWQIYQGQGTFVPGTGFVSTVGPTFDTITIELILPHALTIEGMNLSMCATQPEGPGEQRFHRLFLGGAQVASYDIVQGIVPCDTHSSTGAISVNADTLFIRLESSGNGGTCTIQDVVICGSGPNPYATPVDCPYPCHG